MWNDYKLRKKEPPRRFLLLVEPHLRAASPPDSASGATSPANSLRRPPASGSRARRSPRGQRYAGAPPPGRDQGLSASRTWHFRPAENNPFGPPGLNGDDNGIHTDAEDHGYTLKSQSEPALSVWSRIRTATGTGLLIGGLALLSLPAHHFIMDDLPATAAAGLPALFALWAALRLAQPSPARLPEKNAPSSN